MEGRIAYRVLLEKREGKRPLGRPKRKWEDSIINDIQEVEWEHGRD
jgi:hypothetical protein